MDVHRTSIQTHPSHCAFACGSLPLTRPGAATVCRIRVSFFYQPAAWDAWRRDCGYVQSPVTMGKGQIIGRNAPRRDCGGILRPVVKDESFWVLLMEEYLFHLERFGRFLRLMEVFSFHRAHSVAAGKGKSEARTSSISRRTIQKNKDYLPGDEFFARWSHHWTTRAYPSGPPSHRFDRVGPMRPLFGSTLAAVRQGGADEAAFRAHPRSSSTG